jgi:pimeloyl-ACP methyl ester carboxylesterase
MGDAKAVMDAAGSSRAMVLGHGDGGLVAMLFAATHPERVSGLVLVDAYALLASDEGRGMGPGVPRPDVGVIR